MLPGKKNNFALLSENRKGL